MENFEKVNPAHPDKVADRIAGALVDLAYSKNDNPIIAVEVLIGHGHCYIINETNQHFTSDDVKAITQRIAGIDDIEYVEVRQDEHLAENQASDIRCGDNGIFKGCPITDIEKKMMDVATKMYADYKSDGKYIMGDQFVICQSNAKSETLRGIYPDAIVNPLGDWTGGINVDSGATNRKLGSDMGAAVTGGGLHGKDLSKADVTLNIYAHLKAQKSGHPEYISCAIGQSEVDGKSYKELVEVAREYIKIIGGFEKFAEWGIIR